MAWVGIRGVYRADWRGAGGVFGVLLCVKYAEMTESRQTPDATRPDNIAKACVQGLVINEWVTRRGLRNRLGHEPGGWNEAAPFHDAVAVMTFERLRFRRWLHLYRLGSQQLIERTNQFAYLL